ncbi:hypothetical protein [Massilia violaceinigra]|uniref:hypothetical protein n=1 Tax=Massilia violaceinigra TaxID=2045208 RepID=UPI001FB55A9F|nr:hypothetical protein [Massilia violaceinigra]
MGHKLGIKVIAKGVETQEQRDLLTGAAPKRMRRRGACGACTSRARHIPLPDQALGATHQNGTIIA